MSQMLVITMREGIEAFLIVAIAAAYLRKTGREALLPAVWWGAGAALLLSIVLGAFLAEYAVTPLYEGVLAVVAAALVISMVVYMLRTAKHLRREIGAKLESAAAAPGAGAWLGVFLFVLLMITREGMELAFVAASLVGQTQAAELLTGAAGGVVLAAALAAAWIRYGQRVDLALFFQVTSIFLVLLFYAFHEFTEANALPIDNAYWHLATEEWAEGTYAQVISALLVIVPLLWLAARAPASRRAALSRSAADRHDRPRPRS
jgi:high-affinity iron transporter